MGAKGNMIIEERLPSVATINMDELEETSKESEDSTPQARPRGKRPPKERHS